MIWTVPRTKSTVLCKSLASSQKIKCFYEPFCFAFFNKGQLTFDEIRESLDEEFFGSSENVFLKAMPIFVDNFENWVGDLSVKHAISIRDPLEVSLSTILMNGQNVPYLESRHSYSIEEYMQVMLEEYMQVMLDMKNFLEQTGRKFEVLTRLF